MSKESLEEPWYRCVKCRAMFKLKGLIIRHLILHKVHRFENDSDTKCVEDWERVRVVGGSVVKVDLPKEETLSQSGLEFHQIHNHQQTSWILESPTESSPPTGTTTTLTLITVNNGANVGGDSTSTSGYLGPFDPVISQTFLKFGGPGTVIDFNTNSDSTTLPIGGPGIDFPTTENLYRCRYCSAPFAHSRSRAVHEAKVHNEEMIDGYPCQKCNRNFPTIASVQDHYRCTHKITPPVKKAWKLWKTHGGNLSDYIDPQVITLTPTTPTNGLEGENLPALSVVGVDPVSREAGADAASMVSSLDLGLDVTLGLDGTECSSQEQQQQEFESYYFHTDVGPIPITLSDTISSTSGTPLIYSISTSESKSLSNYEASDLKQKSRRKFKKKDSAKKNVVSVTKSKKINKSLKPSTATDPLPVSSGLPPPTPPKLPKDSPFRYQRLKCVKCEKRFRTQWELTLHLGQIHAEFSCEFCSLIFTSNVEALIRHQYTSHNTELGYYTCRNCGKHFGSPRIVQEHVHSHHPDARVPSTSVALKWRRA